jgi:Helix-turn-helix domain
MNLIGYSKWIHAVVIRKSEKCISARFYYAGGNVNTLNLNEAASYLKMNPEVLRRKARAGQVPGRKAGKRWIFVKEHLADWVSGRYSEPRRELQVIDRLKQEDKKQCQSTSEKKRGGFSSPHRTDAEYSKLLGLK